MHSVTDIEMIHTKFLRRILGVKNSTNLSALYGETGRAPLKIIRQLNMIKYWIKILKQNDRSLVKKTFNFLKVDADNDRNYNGLSWASHIKSTLNLHVFWNDQGNIEVPNLAIKQRLLDSYQHD